ncbi:MAG TPA: sulfatase [Chitinophaga sp.]|uniref:sulfatase family protein n=1 Tax=Chitinophaga sp. TaxID=1869181 RepID=UPI002B92854D|nr:sulfatase [Chitinophaga sp.]HVI43448.1 sulfatase [Chitinophaga sp.]
MKHVLQLLLLLAITSVTSVSMAQKQPNIIVILSDDHAYQAISAYGSRLTQTPNIDRIAREGAIFRNAFVNNSLCAPSRATLLTGKYSHSNGLTINDFSQPFNVKQQLFTRILREHNYQTAWIGKWHLQSLPDGFDYWQLLPDQGRYYNPDFITMNKDTVQHTGYVTNIITDITFDWLNRRDTSKPFCVIVGEKATHREWSPDLQDLGAFDHVKFPEPHDFRDDYKGRKAAADQDMSIAKTMQFTYDLKLHINYKKDHPYKKMNAAQQEKFSAYYSQAVDKDFDAHHYTGDSLVSWKYQRYMKDYLSTAKSLDRNIGRILHYLDSTGLSRNTIVIYMSDQGFYLGEHGWFDKRFMYEESLRTPFVMRYPGVIKPGTKVDALVANVDVAPTLLQAAGIAAPADMQGASLLPVVKGKPAPAAWRKAVYYHYYEFGTHHVYPHFGVRTDRYKLIRFYGPIDSWEFYDLKKDPHEMHNSYSDKANSSVISELQRELVKEVTRLKDTSAAGVLRLTL